MGNGYFVFEKIAVFVFGMVIGSFLNVCIHRLPKRQSIVLPASHCPKCSKNIKWYDNIPLVSYAILMGKCRSCKGRIGYRYPLVELLTAILITSLYAVFGVNAKFFAYSILTCGLIIATFVDFDIQEIPDEISLGGLVFGLIFAFAFPSIFGSASRFGALGASLLGVVAGGGSIYLMGFFGELVFKKEAMGGGDVKLMAMIGSILGWQLAIFTFFAAPIFGSVVGIALKIKDGREIIPYGPFLSMAAVVSIFWGERILGALFYGMR
jgi:leader peptidase (prepilin peptidase)/N-methyltransferase